jgi:hypothetical protein
VEGIRPDEEPACYAGTGRQPVRVRVPPLPLTEAIRLDEGPVPKTGRGREPLWVRVPPLPPHAAVVQRTRRRALNPEAGVRLPVAVLDARSSNRKDVGLLLRLWGFESSSGSASPGGRGSRHAAADLRHGGESPSRASMSIRCDGTGILPPQHTRRVGDPAASRRGNSRHASFQRVHGSQTTWSSSNGEDTSTPRS